jgi:hypothetical protein
LDAELEPPLRVEFSHGPGVRQVAMGGPEALDRSAQAINDAMGIIRQMAGRVRQTVRAMPGRPSEVEVAFGIKFDASAGAVIAKAGVEASINVVFRWDINHPVEADLPLGPAAVSVPPQPSP